MKIKRIVLFAIGWFALQSVLGMGSFGILFAYWGDELRAHPESMETFARYVSLIDVVLKVATFIVYLWFLRPLQTRLLLPHALALYASLQILAFAFAAATAWYASTISGEFLLGDVYDWLPVWGKDLAIALIAVGVVYGFRKYKQRRAEPPEAHEPPAQ